MTDLQSKMPQRPVPIGRVEFLKAKYEELSEDEFNKLFEADPTPQKRYLQWLLMQFTKGSLLTEDIYKAADDLVAFHKHKKQLKVRDINQIESPQALYRLIEPYIDKPTGKEIKRSQKDKVWQDIETVYDGPEGKILIPKTEAASCYLGKGTRWCTAATKADNEFEAYNKDGPLLVIIPNRGSGEKYQFHLQSASLMDEADEAVSDPSKTPLSIIWNRILGWVDEQSKDIKLAAVKQDGYAIQHIKDSSDEMKLAAVKQSGFAIQFIKNPSEEMKFAAVKQDGFAIKYIENPSVDVKLAAVKQSGFAIRFIENPSDEMKLAAVNQNAYAIRYIKKPTAIQHIKDSSDEMKLVAVKQNGHAITYIENPSEEMKLAAIKQNGLAIRLIRDPSEEMKLTAVRQNKEAINYIENPSKEVLAIARPNMKHFQHPTLGLYSAPQNLMAYATEKGYKKEVWEAAIKLQREKGHEGVIQITKEMLELGRSQTQTKQLSQANTMQR